MPEESRPIYSSLFSLGGASQFIWQSGALNQFSSDILDCRDVATQGVADFSAAGSIGQSQVWVISYAVGFTAIDAGAFTQDGARSLTVTLQEWFTTVGVAAFVNSQVSFLPALVPNLAKGSFRVEGDGAKLVFDNISGADLEIWWRAWGKAL